MGIWQCQGQPGSADRGSAKEKMGDTAQRILSLTTPRGIEQYWAKAKAYVNELDLYHNAAPFRFGVGLFARQSSQAKCHASEEAVFSLHHGCLARLM